MSALVACGPGSWEPGPDRTTPSTDPAPAGPPVARRDDPTPAEAGPPAVLELPAIGVTAPIVPVGVDDRGEMEVPRDVRTIGWYRFGPSPGSGRGSVVLAGHVDDRVQGHGAFYRLVEIEVGDPVKLVPPGGTALGYRVAAVERIPKAALPVERLFARNGPEVLTLVTCGGEFDREARSYRENVVVTAHRSE